MTNASTQSPTSQSAPASLRQDASLIGLVGLAHMISHFSQLLLAPLFPWIKEAFEVSYAELGFLMTIFFLVSCLSQTLSGFIVDRLGPRPILYLGLLLIALAAFGFSMSAGYWMMAAFSVLAGIGNGVFHPVDYTLINRKVSSQRLGHAYSVHGITGSLGWAFAPVLLVPLAIAFSWRIALASAGCLVLAVLFVIWLNREKLSVSFTPKPRANDTLSADMTVSGSENVLDFLRIPAVWMCFAFFFIYAMSLSVIQTFASEAARQLHSVPLGLIAVCLSTYMVASASGMVFGGFLAFDPKRCEWVVGAGFAVAAFMALLLGLANLPAIAVPVLFGVMGLSTGIAGPARDLLVKRSTPENATGRVYGVVYSGLDIGQAVAPLFFGWLMDHHQYQGIFLGLALIQATLIANALNVSKARRSR